MRCAVLYFACGTIACCVDARQYSRTYGRADFAVLHWLGACLVSNLALVRTICENGQGDVVVVVVVLTLTHGYNAVRGHRTGSNNSGAEDYPRRKNK